MTSVVLVAWLASAAWAGSDESDVQKPASRRHEVSLRVRGMGAPKSILDTWYTDIEDWPSDFGVDEPRPSVKGYSLGLEYVMKGKTTNGIFYVDYFKSTMTDGYFDDRDDNFEDHLHDGHYLEPSKGLGFVTLGADVAYEVHILRTEQTKGKFGLSFLPGGGLGLMIVTGHIDQWKPVPYEEGTDPAAASAYARYESGVAPTTELKIPPVLPVVDINLALRLNFGDRVVVRLEGGLHNLFYYGATAGVMF